jgi:redox-sensing transcriptional repressor
VALFDTDPAKVGLEVEGLRVHAPEDMPAVLAATGAELGVLTVPAEAAQEVAGALVAAGVRGILNFAPGVLRLPPGVRLVSVDLTVQLEQLAFLVQLSGGEGP